MKDLRSTEEKYILSKRAQAIFSETLKRSEKVTNREREDTWANTEIDGKEPFLDVFEELAGEPYDIKLAHSIVRSWTQTEPKVFPDDIIVGVARPRRFVYEHFSWGISNQIWNNDLKHHPKYEGRMPEIIRKMDELYASQMQQKDMDTDIIPEMKRIFGEKDTSGLMWVGGYQGHTVPSYPMLLELGIDGAKEKVRRYMDKETDKEKLTLYRAMLILLDGFSRYAEQYAEAADDETVAENCRKAAHAAPETLGEACQLVWFFCLWDWCDCLGRLDQYLYPYYEKCVRLEGRETAENYIASLWIKCFENGIHNITLGGVTPDGEDAANELTYLLLQLCRTQHQTHPRVSVRINEKSPKELLALTVQMWSEGLSDPTVASDANVIPALCEYGVPLADARDYTILGCQEIEIPGKSNFGCEDGMMNLAKIFEYSLNDGKNQKGEQIGPETGYFEDFHSIEDLWDAFKKQTEYFVPLWAYLTNFGVDIRNANRAKLWKSIFTESCVERGLNLDAGGSVYNYGVIETAGSAAVADSFAALEKAVFTDKKIPKEKIRPALAADFEGYEKERQILLSAPKFGNDEELPDRWCVRVLDFFWSEVGKHKSRRGDVFTGACSLLESGIEMGRQTGALPDGRHAGEPLSNTIGPREGNDKNGVTAMLNSVAKLPLKKGVGGTTLNVLLPVGTLGTKEERESVALIMHEFLQSGGQLAQITTADIEQLRDAQLHPECHRDLIVRIGGFSIEFVQLRRETQDEVISRYS